MSEAMKTSAALIDKGLAALGRRLGSAKTDVQSLAVMITMHAVEHGDITKATTLCDIVRKNGLRADSLEKWFVTEGCASVEEKETEKGKKVKHFTVNKERRALIAHAVKVDGKAKVMGESNSNFLIAFLTSFLFMYMVLAAQFESLVHPITILLALPLTLPFAFLSLFLLRTDFDIYAVFGLFMLFGIVKKNGILQIDYTNILRERGMALNEAILEANKTRLRPILMTTGAMVLGALPLALATGAGAESRRQIGWVIVGGMSLGTLLTVFVVPTVYSLLARRRVPGAITEPVLAPSAAHD